MKAYKNLLISAGIAATLLSSCDKNFDEINTDPNRPEMVETTGLLTYVQRTMAYSCTNETLKGTMAQYWTQINYPSIESYSSGIITGTSTYGYFNERYQIMERANKIIELVESDASTSAYGSTILQVASAKILKYVLILQNVETFGDVPYTQANNYMEYLKPAYDTQDFIFRDIMENLKQINSDLTGVTSGWTSGDVMFGGSPEKWRRFANSLRLCIAIRLSNYDPEFSQTEAAAAIADGVMESNDDNATVYFEGIGSPNEHSLYAANYDRFDRSMTWQFVNILKGDDDKAMGFENPYKGIIDPRSYQYLLTETEAITASEDDIEALEGFPYGVTSAEANVIWNQLILEGSNIKLKVTQNVSDGDLIKVFQPDFWASFMDYTNVALLVCEHNNFDTSWFEKGIRASMEMWGVPAILTEDYIAKVLDKFESADEQTKLNMVITQKYVHNFAHFETESFSEYIRTGYPESLVHNNDQTGRTYILDGDSEGTTYNFYTYDGLDAFLERCPYPSTEDQYNRENLLNAIKNMGGDTRDIPLIWSKNYQK
ncbi:MAG: SusD/RagB family nutrient-binding outer membrane lipoprotein [Rikenellaceae bacterium]